MCIYRRGKSYNTSQISDSEDHEETSGRLGGDMTTIEKNQNFVKL